VRFLPFGLGALFLTACIHIAPRPIAPEVTARDLDRRSLSDPRLKHTSSTWNLDELTRAAFFFHPDLDVARAEAAVARSAIATARERPNPTLNLPIEHKGEAGFNPWITVLGIDVPIETANKRGLRTRHAEDLSRAAELAIAQSAWQVRSAIRTQLVALTTTTDGVAILRRQSDIQNDLVEALQKRFELGEGSRVELTTARIAARQTELQLRDRQAQLAQAHVRLAAAVGVPESGTSGFAFTFDVHQLPSADIPAIRERALVARPDMLVSLANYAAAESDLRLELARQYPDLHLAPGFGWDQGNRRWDLGFSSVLPILSRNRGPIAEAEARRSAGEARVIALQARIIAATDEASALYQNALAKLNSANSAMQLQRMQTEAAQRSFNAGQIDRVALRTAELELATSELAYADTLAQAQQALGALEDAVEQPLTTPAMPQVPITNPREGGR
jgi:outer membrane protein, heavy metal efflux system